MKKFLLTLALSICFVSSLHSAESREQLQKNTATTQANNDQWVRYYLGGVFATFPGFGIGHAIQQNYFPMGIIFTTTEVGAILVGGILAVAFQCGHLCRAKGSKATSHTTKKVVINMASAAIGGVTLIGFIAFRTWETINAWLNVPSS